MNMKRSAIFIVCMISAAFNCIHLSSDKGVFKAEYGGIAWIGTDSLLYLSQEHLTRQTDLFVSEDSIIGTKLNTATISNKLNALNSVELLPTGKILEGIKLYYPDRLIAYEDTTSDISSVSPRTYFYNIDENKFDSSKYQNYRILNFIANGNFLANKGFWNFNFASTCGTNCNSYFYWDDYRSSVVMDKTGNILSDSIPYTGVPSPVENILITSGPPIKIKTFPKDSTLYSIQDSSKFNLISWSADGNKFIYVDKALTVHLYSYAPGIATLNSFRLDIDNKPEYARISPNGDYIAVCTKYRLLIYDRSGKQLGMKTL
jgi:hypothetical protein